jgi:phosphoglycerol transferase MdoB-like AlkP superfamily enzyme
MGFDAFTKIAGYHRYFGKNEYGKDDGFDGVWGIWDEPFFQFFADEMNKMKEPFLTTIFSVSSHHPFAVPTQYQQLFPEEDIPLQKCIRYTDLALREFFDKSSKMPWFKNTLFVITADHTSEGYYPYYQSDIGQYAIPLLFFKPGSDLQGKSTVIAQQTDVLPTVMNYLGYDKNYLAFGSDLLDSNSTAAHFSIHYISGFYGLMKDGYYLESNGTKSTALYNMIKDQLQTNNLVGKEIDVQKRMEVFLNAYLQQYNNRLIENRLMVDG